MFHDHVDYFQKPPLGGKPNTKPRDHGTLNAHNRSFILFLSCVRTRMSRNSLKQHLVEDLVAYDLTLHLRVRDHITWFRRCIRTAFGHLFFWTLTISWSRLLARLWSGPMSPCVAFRASHCHILRANGMRVACWVMLCTPTLLRLKSKTQNSYPWELRDHHMNPHFDNA
jgi:hypothetical protein